jgi:hypothetical protein
VRLLTQREMDDLYFMSYEERAEFWRKRREEQEAEEVYADMLRDREIDDKMTGDL